jgi:formyltetrahydrofolate hydrolase
MTQTFTLTLSCPQRPGIVHAVSSFLLGRAINIHHSFLPGYCAATAPSSSADAVTQTIARTAFSNPVT